LCGSLISNGDYFKGGPAELSHLFLDRRSWNDENKSNQIVDLRKARVSAHLDFFGYRIDGLDASGKGVVVGVSKHREACGDMVFQRNQEWASVIKPLVKLLRNHLKPQECGSSPETTPLIILILVCLGPWSLEAERLAA
jgi:hypothetical protein